MIFNSIDFAIFLPVVFFLYWFVVNNKLKYQNLLILISSYFFYGWWDWRFLSLIVFSSFVDYIVSLKLSNEDNENKRKLLLYVSVLVNIGFLGFFKYFNFFAESFAQSFSFLGMSFDAITLNIILPVGISFYTFQTLSYTIDVYKKEIKPTNDMIAFFAFVSFFPQLVAGPIERAKNLLPQFYRKREFDLNEAVDGMRQILWGFFKKIVIADSIAIYVNEIFSNHNDYSGIIILAGAFLFAFQIYGDFSGYSDIAIGTARLFGFKLMQNFAFPYFSRDIAEFWRRWHISLSTWFRDYVYIPLGGSKGSIWNKIRNIFIIFIVSGFWHGANWTFIAWGFLNALYFIPLMLFKLNRKNLNLAAEGKLFPSVSEFLQISLTFLLTSFAWIFFRADTISDAFLMVKQIFSSSFYSNTIQDLISISKGNMTVVHLSFVLLLIIVEWLQRDKKHALESFHSNLLVRWSVYIVLTIIILFSGEYHNPQEFIYFQF